MHLGSRPKLIIISELNREVTQIRAASSISQTSELIAGKENAMEA